MIKFFLAALATLMASPAFSQAWGPDGQQPRVWVFPEVVDTGALPMDAFEPAKAADHVDYVQSQWVITGATGASYVKDPLRERKLRFTCEPSTAKKLDSILFPGIPAPIGHRHQGYGLINWDQNTTYATMRANPASSCHGGPANSSNYWEPEVLTLLPSGYIAGIRPENQTVYYVLSESQGTASTGTWFRRDWAMIAGVKPGDYNDQALRNEYVAAGMYYPGTPQTPAGFGGWQCTSSIGGAGVPVSRVESRMLSIGGIASTTHARHLKGPGGEDPWGGLCTGSVGAPGTLILNLKSPGCSDAHNIQSPDGRSHMVYAGKKTDSSFINVCPQNWAHVPEIDIKTDFRHAGVADYSTWYLSSDRLNAPNVTADVTSLDPCRATGPYFCNGSTAHFDWRYGWDSDLFDLGQRECLGIAVRGIAPVNGPAECNTSALSIDQRLIFGGTSPNAALSGCTVITACTSAVPGNPQRYAPLSRHETVIEAHIH